MKEKSITVWFENDIMLEGNRKYISIPALLIDNFEELKIDMKLFSYICLITSNQKSYYMKREEVARKLKTTERTVSNWNDKLIKLGYLKISIIKIENQNTGKITTIKTMYDISGLEKKLKSLLEIKTTVKNDTQTVSKKEENTSQNVNPVFDPSPLTEITSEINAESNFTYKSSYPSDNKKEEVYSKETITLIDNFHTKLANHQLQVSDNYNDYQFLEDNKKYIDYIPFAFDYITSISDLPFDYENNISFLFNKNRKGRFISFCNEEMEELAHIRQMEKMKTGINKLALQYDSNTHFSENSEAESHCKHIKKTIKQPVIEEYELTEEDIEDFAAIFQ